MFLIVGGNTISTTMVVYELENLQMLGVGADFGILMISNCIYNTTRLLSITQS